MYYNCVTAINESTLTQGELMSQIQSLAFAINDLALYLDTHIQDQKAIDLHNEYAKKYRRLYDEYERRYGPLSIYCPCESWRWISSPWPSFILEATTYLHFFSLSNEKI